MKTRTALIIMGLGCIGYKQCHRTDPHCSVLQNRALLVPNTQAPLSVKSDDNVSLVTMDTKFDPVRAKEGHLIRDSFRSIVAQSPKTRIYIAGLYYVMHELFRLDSKTHGLSGEEIDIAQLLNQQTAEQIKLKYVINGDDSTSQVTLSRKGLQELVNYNDSLQHAYHLEPHAPLYILDNTEDAKDVSIGQANAQAGNGKIGITLPMLYNYTLREIKSVIGHELAHEFYQNDQTAKNQSSLQMEHEADSIGIILTNDPYGGILSHKKALLFMKKNSYNDLVAIDHPREIDRIKFFEKEQKRLNAKFKL